MGNSNRPGMAGHERSFQGLTDTWLTPPEIIEALGPFDLDPCAAPKPRPWKTAKTMVSLPDDGLARVWQGRVWLNPPYGPRTKRWLYRLARHGNGTALIFARTETEAFVTYVWGKATAVLFLGQRVNFYTATGHRSGSNAGCPSVLVAYGEYDAQRLRDSGINGKWLRVN